MRNRLTQRVAADTVADKGTGIMNDPYQVNNPEHEKNDPEMSSYVIGDPEKFGEGVNKDDLWKKDKRDPGTHIPEITAKMAADAIKAGRNLEEKAVKCIVASQRILPGAVDAVIESQAAELLHLPDNMIDNLLGRQEDLANSIAKAAADTSKEVQEDEEKDKDASKGCKKEDEEGEEVEAAKACKKEDEEGEEVEAAAKKMEELLAKQAALQAEFVKLAGEIPAGLKAFQEKQKAKKGQKPVEEKKEEEKDAMTDEEKAKAKAEEEEKDAGEIPAGLKAFQEKKKEEKGKEEKDAMTDEEKAKAKAEEEKDAAKKVAPVEKKKPDEKKPEDEITFGDTGEGKDASQNLLDDIFSSVIASDTKKGAKSLSGLVKKEASEAKDPLDGIWNAPPDVSSHFK